MLLNLLRASQQARILLTLVLLAVVTWSYAESRPPAEPEAEQPSELRVVDADAPNAVVAEIARPVQPELSEPVADANGAATANTPVSVLVVETERAEKKPEKTEPVKKGLAATQAVEAAAASGEPVYKAPEPGSLQVSVDESPSAPIYTSPEVASPPKARSIELGQPVLVPVAPLQDNRVAPVVDAMPVAENVAADEVDPLGEGPQEQEPPPLIILGAEVMPSTTTRLSWSPSQSFEGIAVPTPILIANGANPGPTLCLTAAIHGDELNGIEIVRRTLYNLQPEELSGTVIGVPIVNLQGFHRSSRYLTDRRDLNRYFPGNTAGSSASRIAHSFFTEVISLCDALVDLHTGSFHRTNLPQLRADISKPQVAELTQGFGATVVLRSEGAVGTLRRAAVDAGIAAVTLEAGESMRLQEDAVKHGVKGIRTLMNQMGMIDTFSLWGDPEPVYYNSTWVRSDRGGILFGSVDLGDRVDEGDLLGVVTDPITNIQSEIRSPTDGRIIGMALNQVVMPGFAAFHVGIRASKQAAVTPPDVEKPVLEVDPAAPTATDGARVEPDGGAEGASEAMTSPALVDVPAATSEIGGLVGEGSMDIESPDEFD